MSSLYQQHLFSERGLIGNSHWLDPGNWYPPHQTLHGIFERYRASRFWTFRPVFFSGSRAAGSEAYGNRVRAHSMHIVDACASCLHAHSRFALSDARTRTYKNRLKSPERGASPIPFKVAAQSLMARVPGARRPQSPDAIKRSNLERDGLGDVIRPVRIANLSSLRKQVMLT